MGILENTVKYLLFFRLLVVGFSYYLHLDTSGISMLFSLEGFITEQHLVLFKSMLIDSVIRVLEAVELYCRYEGLY